MAISNIRRMHALLSCAALAACLSGCASTRATDIQRARLVVIDEDIAFRSRLTETQLARLGCTYATHDPAALRALQHMLGATRFDPAPEDVATRLEPRYALYLDKPDTTSTLLLGRRYNGVPQRDGVLDGKPVRAPLDLAPQLVQWARAAGIPQSNTHCINAAPPA